MALFDNSPDVIVALDGRGKLLMINNSIERLIGVPAKEFISGRQGILDYYPRGLVRKIMTIFKGDQYGPPGVISDFETFVLDREGREIPVSFSGTLIEEDGKVKMTVGFVRDIRKRKAIQSELSNARRYLDLIFNTMTDGIRVIDSSLTIEYENQKLKDMLGSGVGKKCYQTHFHLSGRKKGKCEDCPAFPVKQGSTFTREIKGGNDSTYLISSTTFNMKGENPSILQVVKDITPLKEKERIQIDQQKLKAIMELAGATAHELNQPLTAITMGLELILRRIQNRRTIPRDVIRSTIESAEKMSAIINKLSEITQYETRSYLETMEILDINGSSKKT